MNKDFLLGNLVKWGQERSLAVAVQQKSTPINKRLTSVSNSLHCCNLLNKCGSNLCSKKTPPPGLYSKFQIDVVESVEVGPQKYPGSIRSDKISSSLLTKITNLEFIS